LDDLSQNLTIKHIKDNRAKIVFYDFKTQQNMHVERGYKTRVHVPNLCVVQQVCIYCLYDDYMIKLSQHCRIREYIFDKDPVKQFVDLITKPHTFSRTICIAHNAKVFNAQFILQYFAMKGSPNQ